MRYTFRMKTNEQPFGGMKLSEPEKGEDITLKEMVEVARVKVEKKPETPEQKKKQEDLMYKFLGGAEAKKMPPPEKSQDQGMERVV